MLKINLNLDPENAEGGRAFIKHAEAEKAHEEARLQADDKYADADDYLEANEEISDSLPIQSKTREICEEEEIEVPTPKDVVKAVREEGVKSKLKRRKSGFKKEDKKKATSSVETLFVDKTTAEAVSALCDCNDEIEELTTTVNAIKKSLGRHALDNWYAGGERSVRIEGAEGTDDEAVVSVKEKTTGKVIADEAVLEDILDRKGIDINSMVEERTTLKIDTKIIDALDDEGAFLEELKSLADKHGVGAAITEVNTLTPKAGLHEERRSIGQFVAAGKHEGKGLIDMEEVLPITTSVNTKVKRK